MFAAHRPPSPAGAQVPVSPSPPSPGGNYTPPTFSCATFIGLSLVAQLPDAAETLQDARMMVAVDMCSPYDDVEGIGYPRYHNVLWIEDLPTDSAVVLGGHELG